MNVYEWNCFDRTVPMTSIDGAFDYHLPGVRCSCEDGSVVAPGEFAFPAFAFDQANPLFTDEEFRVSVSLEELEAIRRSILDPVGRSVWMPPGAELGPYVGTSHTTKLTDFVDGGHILVSKAAVERLAQAGVHLLTGPAQVRCRGKLLDSHWVLHVEPTLEPTLTKATLEAKSMVCCPQCGVCRCTKHQRSVKPGERRLDGRQVPKGPTLFRLYEWGQLLATDEDVDTVSGLGLSGVTFEKWGEVE